VICPDFTRLCDYEYGECKNFCSGNGYCRGTFCECKKGWKGDDCSRPDWKAIFAAV